MNSTDSTIARGTRKSCLDVTEDLQEVRNAVPMSDQQNFTATKPWWILNSSKYELYFWNCSKAYNTLKNCIELRHHMLNDSGATNDFGQILGPTAPQRQEDKAAFDWTQTHPSQRDCEGFAMEESRPNPNLHQAVALREPTPHP